MLKAQEVDSAWIANNFGLRLKKLEGTLLKDYTFVDPNGNKKSLNDFKGKSLYIDIWTTWCKSCIISFPYREQLIKRINALRLDTTIVFITICTEDSEKKWRKLINELNPSGINLYAKDTSLYENWKISSFPTYMLVDTTGKIVSGDILDPDHASIDFLLYAFVKGIKPSEAIWIDFRQYQYYRKHQKFTDDEEGRDYAKWHNASMPLLIEYFKWRQTKTK